MYTDQRSGHKRRSLRHRKCAVPGAEENNDLTEVGVQSSQIHFAVVVEVANLQAIEFGGNLNGTGRGFIEGPVAVA